MVSWLESKMPKDYPHCDHLTAKRVCELALSGDELAIEAVKREAHYLGLGLANLVTLFAPDAIVLGGSVMESAVLFLEDIRKTICRCCHFVPVEKTELALASLGKDANLIGAARVWHHRFAQEGGQRA
jgi:glucokinase